ncbi:hypothetical protein ABZ477_00600 [Microbacterium sp. NPDC019599]|uniref:hypothetical protein n=1 Tax=Microbacterium sp. NPDC019599 TaxID=3154690 RepID=UPI0033E59C5B
MAWSALRPWERYLAKVHATALRYPEARFVLESAAALRGLPVIGEPADVHVVDEPLATSRAVSGVRVHTAQALPDIREVGGLLVAAPEEIAVDMARLRHHAIGLAVAGMVMRQHPEIDPAALRELNRIRRSSRGRRHARWVIERATGEAESTLELVSLAAIEWLGFPEPELQKWILGPDAGRDDRLDFWWEATRTGGEADGDSKYDGQDAAAMLRTRRDRDARLLDRGVSATAHWGWTDVSRVTPLRAALLAAGLKPERPEDTAELRSLTRVLRSTSNPTGTARLQ